MSQVKRLNFGFFVIRLVAPSAQGCIWIADFPEQSA